MKTLKEHIDTLSSHLGTYPNKSKCEEFINELLIFMFPLMGKSNSDENKLRLIFMKILSDDLNEVEKVKIRDEFFNELKKTYEKLIQDAMAISKFDPAAKSVEEVIAVYPGFLAIAAYRIAHLLYNKNIQFIPRIFTEFAHARTGIDIHPGAKIGNPFCIDHGTGIVIGETTEIGNNVKIFQGVTLGAMSVSKEKQNNKRHPTIGNNVIIYSGATLLGGNTIIGNDSVIGGNVWLTESVPENSKVFYSQEIVVQR